VYSLHVKGWQLLVLIALLCSALMVVILDVLPIVEAGPEYIVAYPCNSSETGIAQVYHLSDQDFSDHPVLNELLLRRKRVIRAGSTMNFLLGFFGGPAYSWMPLSAQEEHVLFTQYPPILEYNSSLYRIAISSRE
jgi:hypothetical protein